jgi:hypothetical protein
MTYDSIENFFGDLIDKGHKIFIEEITRKNNRHDKNFYNYVYKIKIENAVITVLKSESSVVYFITHIGIPLNNDSKYKKLFPYNNIDEYLLDVDFGNIFIAELNENSITYEYNEFWEYIDLVFHDNGTLKDVVFRFAVE